MQSARTPAQFNGAGAGDRSDRVAGTWRVADVVAATLLTTGLLLAAGLSGFFISLGLAMSSDCGTGPNCPSTDLLERVWVVASALLLLAVLVGVGGLIRALVKKRVLWWWPTAGYPVVVLAWLTVIVTVG